MIWGITPGKRSLKICKVAGRRWASLKAGMTIESFEYEGNEVL
jgi:hypothetical protein